MKRKIPTYIVTFDSEVTAVSLVENPAIEENFIFFSKDEEVKKIHL